jgi:hypothetical protein
VDPQEKIRIEIKSRVKIMGKKLSLAGFGTERQEG